MHSISSSAVRPDADGNWSARLALSGPAPPEAEAAENGKAKAKGGGAAPAAAGGGTASTVNPLMKQLFGGYGGDAAGSDGDAGRKAAAAAARRPPWIPCTVAAGKLSVVLRCYHPSKAMLDDPGSVRLPVVRKAAAPPAAGDARR